MFSGVEALMKLAREMDYPEMDFRFPRFLFVRIIAHFGRKKKGDFETMEDNNNVNQDANPAAGQETGEKTFTQEDVNRIVQERLAKEKAKNSGETDFAKREQELAQRELHMTAKELLSEKGLPVQLFDALNCADKETMKKSIATIETVFNEYKANAAKKQTFTGFQPGASTRMPNSGDVGDLEIRKAMRLRT